MPSAGYQNKESMSLDKWKHLQFIALEWRLRFKVFPVVQNLQYPPIAVVNLGLARCNDKWVKITSQEENMNLPLVQKTQHI